MNNLQYFQEYIDYYKKIENPGYAVLVTGAWGSGKTYQIKKSLSEDEMYYVSLFDLTSVDAIYSTVFYKMSPAKAIARDTAKGMSDASIGSEAFTFGLGGILGKVANAIIKEEVKKDRVIVFDDIERCSVDINEILGVINKYVEHHGCKVIAIAHDDEIEGAFDKAKEKVIGQTLR
ncbi:P-loop NTPase fold protein, partial [Cronobacter dublinensis]|uniref:P-loop NTPase fold protein n=1 Tax=Cronobacter dublinensis TaxID=413497 RepID=UPI001F2D2FA8